MRQRGRQLTEDCARIPPPLRRILLGPSGMERSQLHRPGSNGGDHIREADQDADRRGGADVEADDEGRRHYRSFAQPSLSATSMKRLTRSPSTGFQVLPSTLKWV